MQSHAHFIDGRWQPARADAIALPVTDSFTGGVFASAPAAGAAEVDAAVQAARRAFDGWAATPPAERAAALRRIAAALRERAPAIAADTSREVGMPARLARRLQADAPIAAWDATAALADGFPWEAPLGHSRIVQAPVGVVACITPWNYPLHQITGKVAPALLAGCTVVLKPSELAPSAAMHLAEAVAQAGLPPGVFNLVHGDGPGAGEALVAHPAVDMVSFTGSTHAGRRIAARAAADIKRLALELGGKSAAVVLPGADLAAALRATLAGAFLNSGQTCSATTRLLVPRETLPDVEARLRDGLAAFRMGDPADPATRLGPLVSATQRSRVLAMVDAALADGARRLAPPAPVPETGFFVAPTVLLDVRPGMAIAQDEVFGPVLAVIAYDGVDDAVAIANGTDYGLAATVWGATTAEALAVARRLRAGQVDVNGAAFNPAAPFGGFRRSGLGRENGRAGLEAFVEPIAIQLPPDAA